MLGERHVWYRRGPGMSAECSRCGARVHWPIAREVCPTPSGDYQPQHLRNLVSLPPSELRKDLERWG